MIFSRPRQAQLVPAAFRLGAVGIGFTLSVVSGETMFGSDRGRGRFLGNRIRTWSLASLLAVVSLSSNVGTAVSAEQDDLKSSLGGGTEHTVDHRKVWAAATSSYLRKWRDEETNVDALGRSFLDLAAAFAYVHDQISLEPYAGLLKGPTGTLVSRGGNDLDRSILLAELLKKQGFVVNLAHGKLAPEQAKMLYQALLARRSKTELMYPSFRGKDSGSKSATQANFQAALDRFSADSYDRAVQAATAKAAELARITDSAGLDFGLHGEDHILQTLADHFWLQVHVNDKIIDLDTSFSSAKIGEAFCSAFETLDVGQASTKLAQQVTFTVVADYLDGDRSESREVLRHQFPSPDLWGKVIRLAVFPASADPKENELRALLRVGDDSYRGQGFKIRDAASAEKPAPQAGIQGLQGVFGGLAGALGGAARVPPSSSRATGPVLMRVHLDFETSAPNADHGTSLAPRVSTRVLFDHSPPVGTVSETNASSLTVSDTAVRAQALQVWDGMVSFGSMHPAYLATVIQRWLGVESELTRAVPEGTALQGKRLAAAPGPVIPPQLAIMLARSARVGAILADRIGDVRGFYERPRLTFLRHGYQATDVADTSKPPKYAEGIDLIDPSMVFVGDRARAVELARQWGIADAYLEGDWEITRTQLNVLPLASEAAAQSLQLQFLSRNAVLEISDQAVPHVVRSVLLRDLDAGNAILAPSALIDTAIGRHYTWWSIDPSTGFPTGRVDLGGGQGLLEYAEQEKNLTYLPEQTAGFVGDIDRCYFAGVVSALSGNTSGVDTHECVKKAACEMLAAIIAQEAKGFPQLLTSPELEEEQEIESLIEQLIDDLQKYDATFISEQAGERAANAACEAIGGD